MYYGAEDVEKTLRCSFCKEKFQDVVKFVPECGCFICGKCHADAREEAGSEIGRYKCEACQETHLMPENGLPDCKQLLPLLKSKPLEKPLSENAKKLKKLVNEVVNELEKLETFDGKEVVNEHCDRLEHEVKETVASAIEHLSKIEVDLLKEINEYRSQCLSKSDTYDGGKTTNELHDLSSQVKKFHTKWSHYFAQLDLYANEADIHTSLPQIDHFRDEIQSLEMRLRKEVLGGQILVFKQNSAFFQRTDSVGTIANLARRETRILGPPTFTLTGHSRRIWAVLHLPQNRLASCSDDRTIRVWDAKKSQELFKLEGHTSYVFTLAILLNGQLASGSGDTTIKIWDMNLRKEIRTLCGHTAWVFSISTLKNGNLASCSNDDTIKIWNPYSSENQLLLTITGHAIDGWLVSHGVLSNDSLVSCSSDAPGQEVAVIRVWSSNDGKLIKEVPTGFMAARALLVLRGDRVAIGYQGGEIRIVDLTNDANSVTKDRAHDSSVFSLAQPSSGNLISYGKNNSKPTIKVWTMPDFGLLQTIDTEHLKNIISLSISSDETSLASAGEDNTIKLWAITN